MSLSEVQARTVELRGRLQALTAGRPGAGGPLGAAGAFAAELSRAGGPAAGTSSASSSTSSSTSSSVGRSAAGPAGAAPTGADVVATAKQQLGKPYVWGGESLAEGGFDCSGLLQWAYAQHGIDLPRVSTQQATVGREVTAAQAQPGDLVFFERGKVDHIGMYAGDGKWVVAPRTGDVVKVQDVDLSKATTIRRVLPDPSVPSVASGPSVPVVRSASLRAGGALPGLPAAGQQYAAQIAAAASEAGIPPQLLAAVAWSESGFDPRARSSAGAVGLVQLMPRTAASLGVTDPTDPVQSLSGGARYLKQQLDAFGGRTDLALAAYNAGPTAVRRAGGIPDYQETKDYVKKVLDRVRTLGGAA